MNNGPVNFDDFVKGHTEVKNGKPGNESNAFERPFNSLGGWQYESEEDIELEILTRTDEKGGKEKSFTLADGRAVIVKTLTGKDSLKAMNIAGLGKKGNSGSDHYLPALMHLSCTINDKIYPVEYYPDLPLKDFNRIMAVVTSLNF